MLNITLPGENSPFIIRPVPLISISQTPIRNKKGFLGSYYDITLTGTILSDYSSPYYRADGTGDISEPATLTSANIKDDYALPTREKIDLGHAMSAIIYKQNLLRELFKTDGAKYELLPASVGLPDVDNYENLSDEAVLTFYPTLQSINFEEGIYVNTCRYTVTLRAEVLLDNQNRVISDGLVNSTYIDGTTLSRKDTRQTIDQVLSSGAFIEDYSESWSIEVDEGKGITNTSDGTSLDTNYTYDPNTHILSSRGYRLTRNVTVTGRTIYKDENTRLEAWQQAKSYIDKVVLKDKDNNINNNSSGYEQYLESTYGDMIGSGFLNLAKNFYGGFNHLRTFSIDETAGSVTLTDTWVLCSGTAYEDYNMSLNKGNDAPTQKISINGTIKGLSSHNAGSSYYGGSLPQSPNLSDNNSAYTNALNKYHQISNNGQYGPNCYLYKRAQSLIGATVNHIPLSVALGTNEFTGELTYTIDYDTRPLNLLTGTLSESINCSDTYPGDVFALIPVLGRATGPVMQYIGGRTEYQRSLSLDLTFEQYYDSGSAGTFQDRIRRFALLSKPSLNEPYRSQINSIISAYSPANEFGIRKYFLSPPQETWDAKTGKYTLNLTWTYELSR